MQNVNLSSIYLLCHKAFYEIFLLVLAVVPQAIDRAPFICYTGFEIKTSSCRWLRMAIFFYGSSAQHKIDISLRKTLGSECEVKLELLHHSYEWKQNIKFHQRLKIILGKLLIFNGIVTSLLNV